MGFTEDCVYVFNADSTYTSTAKGRTTKGTYSYNSETKELTMKTRLDIKFNATVHQGLAKNKMSLLFKETSYDADASNRRQVRQQVVKFHHWC